MRSITGLEVRLQPFVHPAHSKGLGIERSMAVELLVALLLFGLLREWLAPILTLSDVGTFREQLPFFAAVGFVLLVDGLQLPGVLGWPLKLAALLFALQAAMVGSGVANGGGGLFASYFRETSGDLSALLAGEPSGIGAYNRTLFFLLGWMLLAGVVYSLFLHARRGFWFVGTTFVFLLAMQAGAGFELGQAAMRTFGLGLALESVLRYSGRTGSDDERGSGGTAAMAWGGLTLLLLTAGLVAGWAAARTEAPATTAVDWEKVGNRFEAWFGTGGGQEGRIGGTDSLLQERTGYGDDDSRLGAPLKGDDRVAFTAYTTQLTYWRGESKDTYDGRGWQQTAARQELPSALAASDLAAAPGRAMEQELLFPAGSSGRLVAGGEVLAVDKVTTDQGLTIGGQSVWIDATTGRMTARLPADRVADIWMRVAPALTRSGIREETGGAPAGASAKLRADLQLPATLPARVRALAATLTEGRTGTLAKADAIERYLSVDGGFRYSLTEPELPVEGEDFVDHFLFGQKVGYCDHFSTAMVVLLRAAGVPARWVKGYAPGSVNVASSGGASAAAGKPYEVTVRNRDAHSWVEVYVPGSGWVSYDPTPGFAAGGGAASASASAEPLSDEESPAGVQSVATSSPKAADGAGQTAGKAASPVLAGKALLEKASAAIPSWKRLAGLLLAVVLAAVAGLSALQYRRYYGPPLWVVLRGHRSSRRRPQFAIRVLDRLWSRAFRRYGPLSAPQTYREYVASLPPAAGSEVKEALMELAHLTELLRYDTRSTYWIPKHQLRRIWLRLRG